MWERTKRAWSLITKHFKDKGIAGNALLPSDNALVTLTALADKFPEEPFDPIFYWFVQASRFGRYSTSSTSSMEEDLKEVAEAKSLKDALERLLARIRYLPKVTADDSMRDYGDSRSGRLILYLLVQRNEALDWDQKGVRIGFDSEGLLSGFAPQFHHIFPKAFIDGAYPEELVNALANIALIGPAINFQEESDGLRGSLCDHAKETRPGQPRCGPPPRMNATTFLARDQGLRRSAHRG